MEVSSVHQVLASTNIGSQTTKIIPQSNLADSTLLDVHHNTKHVRLLRKNGPFFCNVRATAMKLRTWRRALTAAGCNPICTVETVNNAHQLMFHRITYYFPVVIPRVHHVRHGENANDSCLDIITCHVQVVHTLHVIQNKFSVADSLFPYL